MGKLGKVKLDADGNGAMASRSSTMPATSINSQKSFDLVPHRYREGKTGELS
jgi:hypothetical protein